MEQKIHSNFKKNLPDIYRLAHASDCESDFLKYLREYIIDKSNRDGDSYQETVADTILTMIDNESEVVEDLSTGKKLFFDLFNNLWYFLKFKDSSFCKPDLFEDIYNLLCIVVLKRGITSISDKSFEKMMAKWDSGCESKIMKVRKANIEKIKYLLKQKIENKNGCGRYKFHEEMSEKEKIDQISSWWSDYQFHLTLAIKSPLELNHFLGNSLSNETMRILKRAKAKGIPFFVTPYYLSILNQSGAHFNDESVRSYIIYSENLVKTYGNIKAWEKEDIVKKGEPNAAGWIIPYPENIHRRYPEVAIMIPDTRGRGCAGLCASCQRLYGFQKETLNFDFDLLKPKATWDKKLADIMKYFEDDDQLTDILITGGDALMSRNKTLKKILDAVLKMATLKKNFKRVRLGSRLPAYLPIRIDPELIEILSRFKNDALKVGVEQFIIQTHFQSPLEITPEAVTAIRQLQSAGWIISNQHVFNSAASRRGHNSRLRNELNKLGIIPYYTFIVKGFKENRDIYAPLSRAAQEIAEEKIRGYLPEGKSISFSKGFIKTNDQSKFITDYLKSEAIPFISSDRSVLNLPAIGKSMTFSLVSILPTGQRVFKFEYDHTRKHSPVIKEIKNVYITENRSILSYLNDLSRMGEDISQYESIWGYTKCNTEKVFDLFKY